MVSGKEIAVIYGSEWVGKGLTKAIDAVVPLQSTLAKSLVATAFPLLSVAPIRMPETLRDVLLISGAFVATKV